MNIMNCPIIVPGCWGLSIHTRHSPRGLLQARSNLVPWTERPLAFNSMSRDFTEHIFRFSLIQSEFSPHALISLQKTNWSSARREISFPSNHLWWLKLKHRHQQTLFPLTYCTSKKKKKKVVIWVLLNHHSQLTEGSVYRQVHLQAESTSAKYTGQIKCIQPRAPLPYHEAFQTKEATLASLFKIP